MELQGEASISDCVNKTPEAGLFLLLDQFPASIVLNVTELVLIAIFFVTSANSATYVLGVFTSSRELDPSKKVLIIWGMLLSSIASMLLISGGIDGLQIRSNHYSTSLWNHNDLYDGFVVQKSEGGSQGKSEN